MSKPTVSLDLDGVLATYTGWQGIHHIGDPIQGAVEFTKKLSEVATVMIYTTRCKSYLVDAPGPKEKSYDPDRRPAEELVQIVKDWLDKHGFAYDSIYSGQGKPFAVALIDDRAVSCCPQDGVPATEFHCALQHVYFLISQMKPTDTSQALKDHEDLLKPSPSEETLP